MEIERNKEGLYRLIRGLKQDGSGDLELYHEEDWINKDFVKKNLITKEIWKFIDKVIEIDQFPKGYFVNDKHIPSDKSLHRLKIHLMEKSLFENSEIYENEWFNQFIEILKRLNIYLKIDTTKK